MRRSYLPGLDSESDQPLATLEKDFFLNLLIVFLVMIGGQQLVGGGGDPQPVLDVRVLDTGLVELAEPRRVVGLEELGRIAHEAVTRACPSQSRPSGRCSAGITLVYEPMIPVIFVDNALRAVSNHPAATPLLRLERRSMGE